MALLGNHWGQTVAKFALEGSRAHEPPVNAHHAIGQGGHGQNLDPCLERVEPQLKLRDRAPQ